MKAEAHVNEKQCTPQVASAVAGYCDARLGRPKKVYLASPALYNQGYEDGLLVRKRLRGEA